MSKNILDEKLSEEIRGAKTPSAKEAVAMLTGKDKHSIPKPVKKYTEEERAERMAKIKAIREAKEPRAVDDVEHIAEIVHISEIPDGFPNGTVLNDDGTLTLPDGRMIRKKQEVDHEEVS
jgi:hypothetical protein